MLQEEMTLATPEAVASRDTALSVTPLALDFDPVTGNFTLGNQEVSITGAFQITLSEPGTIQINAGENIQFMPSPLGKLPFNTIAGPVLEPPLPTGFTDSVTLTVSDLPPKDKTLGFLLNVAFVGVTPSVNGIETPPIFIVRDSFEPLAFLLHYDQETGSFSFGRPEFEVPIERGTVFLRLGTPVSNQGPQTTIRLDDNNGSVQFVDPFVVFRPNSGATLASHTSTELKIDKTFTNGESIGMSFVIQVSSGGSTCTVQSPDPVIIDKQIGTGGDSF